LLFRPRAKLNIILDSLFNLGKAEGSIDAGQMIKPALARGLQLVGATTRMQDLSFEISSLTNRT
jgi:hypothetical protein